MYSNGASEEVVGRALRDFARREEVVVATKVYAHRMYYQPEDYEVVDRVVALAEKRGVKPVQIALAWLLHQPGVTAPIIGATRMEHLEDAVAALKVRLDDEERKQLEAPYRPHPVLGHE